MNILIAPDSFKGGLTALEVAQSIEKGIKKILPQSKISKIPMADGGEGTVRSLVDATGGTIIKKKVTGPLGEMVEAEFGLLGDKKTAVIEMAKASGLPLLSSREADPSRTTTYGTGELIREALNEDIDKLIIGIGGSATNDAGVGMAQALGGRFLDEEGNEVSFGGKELNKIKNIDISKIKELVKEIKIEVACDVNNPLYGPEGAAQVYAPQKGADPEMVKKLDDNLKYFNKIVRDQLNINLQNIPGAGAAGGLGAGLAAFLGAELRSGIDIVLEVNNFEKKLMETELVITGEGKMDGQTVKGKTAVGVARKAKELDLPVIAINGSLGKDYRLVLDEGIDAVFSCLIKPISLEDAVKNTDSLLEKVSEQVIRTFLISSKL
ncbi:MAG: glycerate kinase [Halanaerobiales bacterium]